MTNKKEITVEEIFFTILRTKKVEQFNVLKADVLASRFYQSGMVEIDEADCSGLQEVIDRNDQFFPFVLAYARRALIEAREGIDKARSRKK